MHAAARCARARLGRRGIALLILGVGLASWGLGYIAAPTTSTRGLELLLLAGPVHRWALVWVVAGGVTFGSAFLRIGRDRWRFVAACVPPFLWAASYGMAAVDGAFTRGAFVCIWYLTSHVGLTLWASRVPEDPLPVRGPK